MRYQGWCVVLATLVLAATLPASAEIGVRIAQPDRVDGYVIRADLERGLLWTRVTGLPSYLLLNEFGDNLGDGDPSCGVILMPMDDPMQSLGRTRGDGGWGDEPTTDYHRVPLVAWSRYDGNDYEIVYSMWDVKARRWHEPAFVERTDNFETDDQPLLLIGTQHQFVVWRRTGATTSSTLVSTGQLMKLSDSYDIWWNPPIAIDSQDLSVLQDPQVVDNPQRVETAMNAIIAAASQASTTPLSARSGSTMP